jgi:hypothetical protein
LVDWNYWNKTHRDSGDNGSKLGVLALNSGEAASLLPLYSSAYSNTFFTTTEISLFFFSIKRGMSFMEAKLAFLEQQLDVVVVVVVVVVVMIEVK